MRAKERTISETTICPMLRSALTFCRRKCRRKGQLATGGRTVLCVWRRYVYPVMDYKIRQVLV